MWFVDFSPWYLVIAYTLDLIIGDPPWMPHPVRWIGNLIARLENILYPQNSAPSWNLMLRGGVLVGLTVLITVGSFWLIAKVLPHPLRDVFLVWTTYTLLATRSLHIETRRVIDALEKGDIEGARKALSWLVSRDTENLDEKGILRGTLETLSENISDGIVAPLFYIGIGGPLLGLFYKAINTLDSMIGYKNERYYYFGRIAARFDDIFNYIPARLTGIFIVSSAWILQFANEYIPIRGSMDWKRGWHIMKRDGRLLPSPNAGIPQAAMAGVLGVQLGGPTSYFGRIFDKPTMGDPIHALSVEAYRLGVVNLYLSSILSLLMSVMLGVISKFILFF